MSDDLSGFSLLELFRAEAESQLAALSEGIIALERGPVSPTAIEPLMRAAHSLKGAARIVNLDPAVGVAHVIEDYFVAVQRGQQSPRPEHVDVLLRGVDLLTKISLLTEATLPGWLAEHEAEVASYVANFETSLTGSAIPDVAVDAAAAVESGAIASAPAPPSEAPAVVVDEPARDRPAPVEPRPPTETPARPSERAEPERVDRVVRVSADSLTKLMALAGESLLESRQLSPCVDALKVAKLGQSRLTARLLALEERLHEGRLLSPDALANLVDDAKQCESLLGERLEELENFAHRGHNLSLRLHHEIVNSRLRPLADGIRGFPRLVRDIARELGKEVRFEIVGDQTGVDRDILDKLEAPLNHIVRNALDHGLETPAERDAARKPRACSLRLEARHRAGMLEIAVEDDGRGIDPLRVKAKVIERGLATAAMADRMADAELFEFLFLPGFSTKETVTQLSGRGVGLDVVQNLVQSLGGNVRVASTLGERTRFELLLPISRSIVRSLLVEIAGEPYAFPLSRIDRIARVSMSELEWLEGRPFVTHDGQSIGLVEASHVLDLPDTDARRDDILSIVVLSDRGHRFGVVVDRILGEDDLSVRPLDPRLGKVPDVGSASLLGDGQTVLVFDVEDLVRSIDNRLSGRRRKPLGGEQRADQTAVPRILVVDDSITVRELERQLLAGKGYEVEIAVDGMDGWNAVRSGSYQLVVSDVDMPRMDGIELVRRIRSDDQLRTLPVVIVSYKDRPEDRMRGLDAGANAYLTKSSFHDQTFLRTVVELVGEAART